MNLENISETVEELLSFSRELGQSCKEGKIKGPVHFSLGNEEQLVKIFRGLRSGEYITSSQRENGYSREDMISKKKIRVAWTIVSLIVILSFIAFMFTSPL